MSRSQYRNMLALLACCLFVHLISVVVGVPHEVFCEVNGKFYREGEQFASTSNPDLTCQCRRGYTGRNVEPFCRPIERIVEDDHSNNKNDYSTENCVEITRNSESPRYTHYTEQYRCPSDKALVPISMTENLRSMKDERSICIFGSKKLGIEDFFYHSMIDDTRNCVKCTCERPPKPTCVRPPNCPLVHIV
ncbi:uncharacterized protein LOC131666750 [Phymastichus coffea]|uniref:uncharacterized protein LOC131666750 n=1 Tax=Phymastichus coffea TaxID=108790 RepID=UPI00273C2259|nr:uncharacterized protein LOC131666750 [Phymastichus coffea]